jgi:hypothetical protein
MIILLGAAGVILLLVMQILGHLPEFECLVCAIMVGAVINKNFHWHPVFIILISVAAFMLVYGIYRAKIGFWIVSIPFSTFYAYIIADEVYRSTQGDMIWTLFAGILTEVIVFGLHLKGRDDIISSIANRKIKKAFGKGQKELVHYETNDDTDPQN